MSFSLLPNVSLIVSVAVLLVLVGRRVPEAIKQVKEEEPEPQHKSTALSYILSLHLPSKVWSKLGFGISRLWHFLLEAKDIKKPAAVGYRIKKMFAKSKPVQTQANMGAVQEKNEQYYLRLIALEPKDLQSYDLLAKYYSSEKRYREAKDIYSYLIKRDPANPSFYAKLAFNSYKLENYEEAVVNYEKSLALDSAQPNRYYNLALALEALGKDEEAFVPLKKALELEPDNKKYQDLKFALEHRKDIGKIKINKETSGKT